MTIKDWPGKETTFLDFLSGVLLVVDYLPMEDKFLDEHVFVVIVKIPSYANLANYLVGGKLLAHLSSLEKNLIIQRNSLFSQIDGQIFHIGPDLQICRCIWEDKVYIVLKLFHDEPYNGNFIN